MTDTIYALSTVAGVSAISVIRLSGKECFRAISALCRVGEAEVKGDRKAHLRKIYSNCGRVLDEGLVLCFEKGRSFTGERMAEIHTHGSSIVISTVLNTLSKMQGLREAKPGEFTKKALENNKLDIFQVEGLSDLLIAETETQQEQAINTLSGSANKQIENWKQTIIKLLALVETVIDFSEDVEITQLVNIIGSKVKKVRKEFQQHLSGFRSAELIRQGFEVAIVGMPNVGKSTLLNFIGNRSLAITSNISGTTRDIVELRYNLGGIPVIFLDTAGIRKNYHDEIEKIGVLRTIDRADNASLRVFLVQESSQIGDLKVKFQSDDIILRPKGDQAGREPSVSGMTGHGVNSMLKKIKGVLEKRVFEAGVVTQRRHFEKIKKSLHTIDAINEMLFKLDKNPEIIAEEFRTLLSTLDGLLGLVDNERVLDEIFSNFCIGK